jgi:hypothetical protein
MKYLLILITLIPLLTLCEKASDTKRLQRREVLYKFQELKDGCTTLWGQGGIKNSSPKEVIESLKQSYSNMGYLSVEKSILTWELPWPFDNISEKISIKELENSIVFKGRHEMKKIKLSAKNGAPGLTVLQVEGTICRDIPIFIKENILSSCIKKVVKTVRDNIE